MNMNIKLSQNQQRIKQHFEPLYERSLADSEVKEISRSIRGFLVTLYKIDKETKNVNAGRIQN